jgi:hypothetical protein
VASRLFRTINAALALACLGRIVIAAQGNPEAAKVKNPVAATPESVAAGKQIFTRNCATCHGSNAEGGPGDREEEVEADLPARLTRHVLLRFGFRSRRFAGPVRCIFQVAGSFVFRVLWIGA